MVSELVDRVKPKYDQVFREYIYYETPDHDKMIGDLDVAGVYREGDHWNLDIYEVKSGAGKSKAAKQLHRAEEEFSEIFEEIRLFRWMQGEDVECISD